MGAKDIEGADYYFKKLLKITVIISVIWNVLVFAITPVLLTFYNLEAKTTQLVIELVIIHNIFNALVFPFSGSLGNGLRAAGDVKYTMIVSIASTVGVRFILSYILGVIFNMGVIGIAFAMCADWTIRAILFIIRYKQGKWKEFNLI